MRDGFASGLCAAAAAPGVAPPFLIKDADMERELPFVIAMPSSFDVLEVVRAFAALLVRNNCQGPWCSNGVVILQ
jgi:hypothetical protein